MENTVRDKPTSRGAPLLVAVVVLVIFSPQVFAGTGDVTHANIMRRMMLLVLQMGVILLAVKLGSMLIEKTGLPGVMGELAAGMIIGPYALGQIAVPGFAEGIFPLGARFPVSAELYGVAMLGAIVLLFTVGLETNLSLLKQYSLAGSLVGFGGVAVSFVLGDLAAVVLYPLLSEGTLGFFDPAALFMGTIACATSVGITARVLSERRSMDTPESVTILTGAVIDDVLGIVILAVVMGIVSARSTETGRMDWGHIAWIAIKAVGIWLSATALGLLASRKIGSLLKFFRTRSSIAFMGLGLALVLAALFEEAGLAMIIGAYVMGLTLSRTDISNVVRERVHFVREFLAPVFFCVMGMLVDLSVFVTPTVLLFGAGYTLAAGAAKLIGSGLPSMFANFNLRGASRIGLGMMPRSEVALIIAGVGVAVGVLDENMLAAVVMMSVVTSIVAPSLLVMLFRGSHSGLRREPRVAQRYESLRFDFPSGNVAEFFVSKIRDVLESDGFYVHRLAPDRPIYQIRKDSLVIDFRLEGQSLIFNYPPGQGNLINAAVIEASADLAEMFRRASQPVDTKALRASIEAEGAGGPSLNLGRFLTPSLINPDLQGQTGQEIIEELMDMLVRARLVRDRKKALQAVMEREDKMPTGLVHGVAVPHGRCDEVGRLVCAVGIHREGIDFGSMDSKPSTIFILTLSPTEKAAPSIQFMAAVSQTLTEEVCRRLMRAETAEEIYRILTTARTTT